MVLDILSLRNGFRKLREMGLKYWVALIVLVLFVVGVVSLGDIPQSDDAAEMLFYATIGFVLSLLGVMYGFREYRKASLIRNTPTSRIRSMAMGLVEVAGTVAQGSNTIESPFTGADCVFYKYQVEEYRRSGKHSRWVTIDTGTNGTSFYVDDGTGKVLVDPRGAELEIPADNTIHVDGGDVPPYEVTEFIEENPEVDSEDESLDLGVAEVDTGNDRRYTEYYVTPGEEVYVFGKAMERPSFQGSARNEENIVVSTDENTPLFMISDSSEKELLSSLKWHTYGAIVGGGVLSIVCFGGMLVLLGLV